MSEAADWTPVEAELARWRAAGHAARLWLRDDDAVTVTPPLERLAALTRDARISTLIAVIPARAEPDLAEFLARQPHWQAAVHGFAHVNHASAGEKKAELGAHRPLNEVLADIARGQERLNRLFASRLAPVLVPPWNRIDKHVAAELPRVGFEVLSAFGPEPRDAITGLKHLNTHLDIIDWRGNRGGRPHDVLIMRLAEALAEARAAGSRPLGILTHHLVHDARAWRFLEVLAEFTQGRRDIAWWPPGEAWGSATGHSGSPRKASTLADGNVISN